MRVLNRVVVDTSKGYCLYPEGKIYVRINEVSFVEGDDSRLLLECEEMETGGICKYHLFLFGKGGEILQQMLDKAGIVYKLSTGEEVYDENMLKGEIFLILNKHRAGKPNPKFVNSTVYFNSFIRILKRCDENLRGISPRQFTTEEIQRIENSFKDRANVQDFLPGDKELGDNEVPF